MQTEQQRQTAERGEAKEKRTVETVESLRQHADEELGQTRDLLGKADVMITEAEADPELQKELAALRGEAEAARAELDRDLGAEPVAEAAMSPEEMRSKAEDMLIDTSAMRDLSRIAEAARGDAALSKSVQEAWSAKIGPEYARRIVEEPAFAAALEKLQSDLDGRLFENGPKLLDGATLAETLAVHEAMGPDAAAFVRANDLSRYAKELQYDMTEFQSVFSIDAAALDKKSGEFDSIIIRSNLDYTDPSGEASNIKRIFKRERTMEDGKESIRKTVKHEKIELAPSLQEGGIAAKMLKECLTEYDRMGLDDITLTANIEVGSYAWATYGFDWDPDEMGEKEIASMAESAQDRLKSVLMQTEVMDFEQQIGEVPYKAALEQALEDLGKARTPQELAAAGSDGPFFVQDGDSQWTVFSARAEAKAKSDELKKVGNASKDFPGLLHPGKLGLMGNTWNGKLELKSGGAQGGKNRKLLEQALARRTG